MSKEQSLTPFPALRGPPTNNADPMDIDRPSSNPYLLFFQAIERSKSLIIPRSVSVSHLFDLLDDPALRMDELLLGMTHALIAINMPLSQHQLKIAHLTKASEAVLDLKRKEGHDRSCQACEYLEMKEQHGIKVTGSETVICATILRLEKVVRREEIYVKDYVGQGM